MHKRFDPRQPYFAGVAVALILAGAGAFALALVELGYNLFRDGSFPNVFPKAVGGLIVLALGYIHLELEMLRVSRGVR